MKSQKNKKYITFFKSLPLIICMMSYRSSSNCNRTSILDTRCAARKFCGKGDHPFHPILGRTLFCL